MYKEIEQMGPGGVQWVRMSRKVWRRIVWDEDGSIKSVLEGERLAIITAVVELELALEGK